MAFNPVIIEKGLRADFARKMAEFQSARELSPGLMQAAMTIQSDGAYEKMGWLGAMPGVQEWIGELNAKALEDYDFTIRNKDWATAAIIHENDVDDDQTGSLQMASAMLVKRLLAHPEKLIAALLTGGTSGLAYDGVAFFADAAGARTFDNLLGGSGTTVANLETDLIAALVAMARFTDDQGEALNIKGNLIVCPKALEYNFKKLVMSNASPTATAGVDTYNPFANGFTVIGDARLDAADATDWYLLATSEIVKPFVFSMRENASPTFEKKNLTKTWVYSADYRGNAGYGLPHLAVKMVNS